MDGVGEWATTSYGVGQGNTITMIGEMKFPHSLGLLYSAFTYFTGFKVNSAEYKVMGLAPYGEPKYVQTIYDHLIDLKEDGSFRMNMEYLRLLRGTPDDERKVRRAVRRTGARTGIDADAAGDGPRPIAPGGDGRDHAPHGPARAPGNGREEPRAWPAASRSTASATAECCAKGRSKTSGFSRRPGMQAERWARRSSPGTHISDNPRTVKADGHDAQQGSYLGPCIHR